MTIEELQADYDRLNQRLKPTPNLYRFATERSDCGAPHVELIGDEIHVVTTERGLELSREVYTKKDDFLYSLISLNTFWMGVDHEFRNRIEDQDCRRIIFANQLELLERIDPRYADRRAREIEETLRENPYND
ncbi:MAG TPA: Imm63 family immunity protein [Pyrinomonadaceae bacterium]|nr:Imm63 family immunity protein [Pyrinomonadaceae bacterium]